MARVTLSLVCAALAAAPASAQGTGLAATYNFEAGHFAAHPTASLMYMTIPSQNEVAVVDTETLELLDTVFVGPNPRGLCLSPLADRLFVCTSNAQQLAVVDAETLALLAPIPLPHFPYDVEAGTQGRVFITANHAGIMQVDTRTGAFLGEFELTVFMYERGLVEISPDRSRLYFANRFVSPGTLACFDVSTTTPSLIWKNSHGALGGAGVNLGLSADGAFVSYACSGGNFIYDIFKIETQTFTSVGRFQTGSYPREVVYAPDDQVVYALHAAQIDRFNATTFVPYAPIVAGADPFELAVDRSGRFVFATFLNQTRVYSTGFGLGSGTTFCAGDNTGAACPCANRGHAGHGCENSRDTGGVLLGTSGVASLAADSLVLDATSFPEDRLGIFLQGESLRSYGLGTVLGDGLLCIGGPIRRLAAAMSVGGRSSFPARGATSISLRGGVPAVPGTTRYYQLWYRDSNPLCSSGSFNWSNAIGVAWLP